MWKFEYGAFRYMSQLIQIITKPYWNEYRREGRGEDNGKEILKRRRILS